MLPTDIRMNFDLWSDYCSKISDEMVGGWLYRAEVVVDGCGLVTDEIINYWLNRAEVEVDICVWKAVIDSKDGCI